MANQTITINVTYLSSGLGVSKVPLAVAGLGIIEATDDALIVKGVKPATNWNAFAGLGIAAAAIVATYMTGKTWVALTGMGVAVGAGFLPKKAGNKKITKKFRWSKVRNVRIGDPEARAHAVRGMNHAGNEILWLEVREGINWKSVKVALAAETIRDFIDFTSNAIDQ